ncbi:hypothetical protein D7X55_20410 [Corallococcus sp. AB049A]|uniref:Uncharacterized protein n=1 Tax=Corallococcus interemptor TaxID=2316720 RepID=A0A3A8QL34_9BACT|nr:MULTISPECIES: DUF5985 family protein [Corallococcus]RKH51108.1 hypothetical protein D7Y23_11020 [Corallococcus sp. AB050B]RKH69373.1 hypothetical protein D7X96_15395 [Corallococcus interemptor]RKI63315.1 hypothetical protein D7X55_20410 [Corallococcus sp. AB049A]
MWKPLLDGAVMMAYLACALFFLRFYLQSKDRLFALFSLAFTLMGLNNLLGAVVGPDLDTERIHYLYVIRLVAYLLILGAIWDKNRAGRGSR